MTPIDSTRARQRVALPLPTDHRADDLLRFACRLTRSEPSRVHVIRALPGADLPPAQVEAIRGWTRARLLERWTWCGGDEDDLEIHLPVGPARKCLCAVLEELKPDLTILRRHPRSTTHGFLRRRLTDAVIASARSPILIVPDEGTGPLWPPGFPTAAVGAAAREAAQRDRPRVVVAEDQPELRAGLIAWLQRFGYAPIGVGDGDAALEEVRSSWAEGRPLPLLLLDHHLPSRCGLSVLGYLREHDLRAPVVFMTAFGQPITAHARRLGAQAVITKPVDLDELRAAVDRALAPRPVGATLVPGAALKLPLEADANGTSMVYYGT